MLPSDALFKPVDQTPHPANRSQTETNNMASIDFSDDSSDTNFTQTSLADSPQPRSDSQERLSEERTIPCPDKNTNIVNKLINRQVSELTLKFGS